MTIAELLERAASGADVTVFNDPFTFAGKAHIVLDGGDVRFWLFGEGDRMLSIAPENEEIVHFLEVDEELEPDSDVLLYQNCEFEFTYEDGGEVQLVEGDIDADEEDRFAFSEYESADGKLLRIVTNENTGFIRVFYGVVVMEDDVLSID